MNRNRRRLRWAAFAAAAILCGCAANRAPLPVSPWTTAGTLALPRADDELRVGAARVEITPDHSACMAGFGVYFGDAARLRWSQGAHDPLYADALVFEKGGERLILIALDLVGLSAPDVADVRDAVARATLTHYDRIIVAANHTHHGPDVLGLWGTIFPPRSGRDEEYATWMKKQAVLAAQLAVAGRRAATLSLAVAVERELHRNLHRNVDPQAATDDALTVLIARDPHGATIATLTNWSCHPTCENAANRLLSADWVGYFRQKMAALSPGLHVYVNGAIGASVQPNGAYRDRFIPRGQDQHFAWAKLLGEALAAKAAAAMADARPLAVDAFEVRRAAVAAHNENRVYVAARRLGIVCAPVPPVGGIYRTEVAAARLGGLRLATFPGELIPNLALEIRRDLGGDAQMLIGLAQDYLGYILDRPRYGDARYKYETLLCVGPDLGENIVRTFQAIGRPEPPAVGLSGR